MELSKKEMCVKYPPCGGWCISNCAFIQIHCVEHGLDDFLYCSLVYDIVALFMIWKHRQSAIN